MFIPNLTPDQVMSVLNGYDHYSDVYKPLITKARCLNETGTMSS
jgi:hypothetical protein